MEIHISQVAQTGTDAQSEPQLYTVQPGDNLVSIAGLFDVSVESLSLINPELLTGELRAGQELKIPLGEGLTGFTVYVVQTSDSLDTLAQKFELASMDLLRANPQLVKLPLVPGSQIRIPQFEKPEQSETLSRSEVDTLDRLNKSPKTIDHKTIDHKTPEHKSREKGSNSDRIYDYALDNISKARLQMMEIPGFGLQQTFEREAEATGDRQSQPQTGKSIPPPFDEWEEFLERASDLYNLPASLLAAIIWRESGGRNIRQNDRYGIFQFDGSRHSEWLRTHDYGMNPESSIDYAAALLRDYRERYKGNMRLALAAFHAGTEIVDLHLQGHLLAESSEPIRFAFEVQTQQEYFRRFFDE